MGADRALVRRTSSCKRRFLCRYEHACAQLALDASKVDTTVVAATLKRAMLRTLQDLEIQRGWSTRQAYKAGVRQTLISLQETTSELTQLRSAFGLLEAECRQLRSES